MNLAAQAGEPMTVPVKSRPACQKVGRTCFLLVTNTQDPALCLTRKRGRLVRHAKSTTRDHRKILLLGRQLWQIPA